MFSINVASGISASLNSFLWVSCSYRLWLGVHRILDACIRHMNVWFQGIYDLKEDERRHLVDPQALDRLAIEID